MPAKLRFGVLGVAKIATAKVIPAMKSCEHCEITAIASRDAARAGAAARGLGIPKHYGSYEALLADPEIDAVYNPLPNNLHVPWSVRAAEAGKHVLCEKPIAMSVEETKQLIEARNRTGVTMAEAFMVRVHPQWLRTRDLIKSGEIGELRAVSGFFSYDNRDPRNIRNLPATGGGGIMDIGCYPINTARWMFAAEPWRVIGLVERDPEFGTDRLSSAILDFPKGQAIFTCSTQLNPYQRMHFHGTRGRVEIEIPFNAPPDRPTRIMVQIGTDIRTETFPVCDQYALQGDAYAAAIRDKRPVPVPLEDALSNMAVIEAVFRSAQTETWAAPLA